MYKVLLPVLGISILVTTTANAQFRVDDGILDSYTSTPLNLQVGSTTQASVTATGQLHVSEICDENGANCGDVSGGLGGAWETVSTDVYRSSGSVGVGLSNPVAHLEVQHTATLGANSASVANAALLIHQGDTQMSLAIDNNEIRQFGSSLNIGGETGLIFHTGDVNNADTLEVARFTKSGDLGLGTTSPDNKLHVNGNVTVNDQMFLKRNAPIFNYFETDQSDGTSGKYWRTLVDGTTFRIDAADNSGYVGYTAPLLLKSNGDVLVYNLCNESGTGCVDMTDGISVGDLKDGVEDFLVIGLGENALQNSTGMANTAFGVWASQENTSGTSNAAFGANALSQNETGENNIAMGFSAGRGKSGSGLANVSRNVFLGTSSGLNVQTGANDNTLVGYSAGSTITTGSGNIMIGSGTHVPSAANSNRLNIGNSIYGNLASDHIGIGNASPNQALDVSGNIEYTGTIADVSDRRLKQNIQQLEGNQLDKIAKVNTVSFEMIDEPNVTEYGVIAQELEEVYPLLVNTADDTSKTMTVNYVGLIAPMVKAMQELRSENDDLRAVNASVLKRLDAMAAEIEQLKSK